MKFDADRRVKVNGVEIHYADTGAGRPVVLLHGNGEDHTLFGAMAAILAEAGFRVVAPDTRGHGANAPLPEYHYADMAEDVRQLIDILGLEKPALYGFSDGGITALLLASSCPDAVGALAVSGANLSPRGLVPEFIAEYTALNAEKPDPLVTLMLTEPDIDPASLGAIRVPALVTAGENDLVRREETDRIAAAIPGARKVILPGQDHAGYVAGSPVMAGLLADFLREVWKG